MTLTGTAGLPNISHQTQVKAVLPHLSTTNMYEFLETFTGYYNRLYTSETGVQSQRWLFDELLDVSISQGLQPCLSLSER